MYHGATPADDFTCEKCQKCFAGKGLLAKHIKHSMCDIMKNYQCEHCRMKYKQKQSLDKHMLLHFPRKKCNLCNLVLSRDKVLIQKHMKCTCKKLKCKKQDPLKGKQFYSREPGNILPMSIIIAIRTISLEDLNT